MLTPPARITPLAPRRFEFQCTLDRDTLDLLRRAQELLGHVMPSGEPVAVLRRVLTDWVQAAERRKYGLTDKPRASKPRRPRARYIPAAVRRAVIKRDGGQCTFVAANGRRCECRKRLEFDHIIPVARGGRTTVENLRLRCRAHNQHEADQVFGPGFMRLRREAKRRRTESAAAAATTPAT